MKDEIDTRGRKWEFDDSVTACFPDMLSRSIPDYATMRDLTTRIGMRFVRPQTVIADIGCSTGLAVEPFVSRFGAQNTYILQDVSAPMLAECRRRFSGMIEAKLLDVRHHDLRRGVGFSNASLILSVLTIQFTPIEYRTQIIQSAYDALVPGGALLLVEKILGDFADIDDLFVSEYYALKRENAYTEEQISAKRKSLEGVLVPVSAKWNREMLASAGFRRVSEYWQYLNFAGFLAVR